MAECSVNDARDQIKSGLAQIQSGIAEIGTEIEAAMYAYHMTDDKEKGRSHLTVGYRKVKAKMEQGLYRVRSSADKVVRKAQRLEREKVKEEEEEQLLEALEDAESPQKKMKVQLSDEEAETTTVTKGEKWGSSQCSSEKEAKAD